MLNLKTTTAFEKNLKKAKKRGKDLGKLSAVLKHLVNQEELPQKYKDHKLIGNYVGCRECHIEPDWLLVYSLEHTDLHLIATGSHSDLFKK